MMRLYAWLLLHGLVVAITAVLAFAVLFGVRQCQDSNSNAERAVMKEKIRVQDSVIKAKDSAYDRQSARLDTVMARGTQVVHDWQTVKVPVFLPPTATVHDTVVSLGKRLSACYAAGDSLVASVVKIQTSCSAFRDTATKAIAAYKIGIAQRDSLIRIGPPKKRFSFGPYIGYGVSTNGTTAAVYRGFSAGIGVTYSIFSW